MSTNVMKALGFSEFGPPSILRIEEVAIPEPGEGDALVHVKGLAQQEPTRFEQRDPRRLKDIRRSNPTLAPWKETQP
jgi:hypothetical protein